MNKKILVTGGLGYIGSHTITDLIQNNYDVVVIDNLSNSNEDMINRLNNIIKDTTRIKYYIGNIDDENLLEEILTDNKIYGVIHFAALKAVGESVLNPLMYYKNNVFSTVYLLNKLEEHKIKNFIFSSSATVYYSENKMPLNEEGKIGAINPYGHTKVVCEEILNSLYESNKNWNIIKLRYFNPLGSHPSHEIGESPRNVPKNLVPYIAKVATGELKELSIFGNDYNTKDGTCVRDYIHVMDLARAHVLSMNYLEKNNNVNEVFNLGSNEGYTVFEILDTFEKVNNVKIPYKIIGRRPGDLDVSYSSSEKAKKLLNWENKKTLEEMLSDNLKWEQNYFNSKKII